MPPKRRRAETHAAQPMAPPAAWGVFFAHGCDYFSDLQDYGVILDNHEAVAAAWMVYGPAFLAQWPELRKTYAPGQPDAYPWAYLTLGDPR